MNSHEELVTALNNLTIVAARLHNAAHPSSPDDAVSKGIAFPGILKALQEAIDTARETLVKAQAP